MIQADKGKEILWTNASNQMFGRPDIIMQAVPLSSSPVLVLRNLPLPLRNFWADKARLTSFIKRWSFNSKEKYQFTHFFKRMACDCVKNKIYCRTICHVSRAGCRGPRTLSRTTANFDLFKDTSVFIYPKIGKGLGPVPSHPHPPKLLWTFKCSWMYWSLTTFCCRWCFPCHYDTLCLRGIRLRCT